MPVNRDARIINCGFDRTHREIRRYVAGLHFNSQDTRGFRIDPYGAFISRTQSLRAGLHLPVRIFTAHLKVVNLGTDTRNGRRAAGSELRIRVGRKEAEQRGRKFPGGPRPADFLQFLLRGAVIDLHVAITFLTVTVNDFSGDHVQGPLLAAALGKSRHELLADKIGKVL